MKKVLDKVSLAWYNNRIRYGKGKSPIMTMNELIATTSIDKALSEHNRATILNVGEAIRQVVNENFREMRHPVIAGGAIRDTIFGLEIKDFDIFFETSAFKDDEAQDIALLLIALICEKLAEHEYPKLRNVRFGTVGHVKEYAVGEGEDRKTPFVVYENYPYDPGPGEWIPGQWNVLLDEPAEPPEERPYSFPMLQVIGHKDDRLRDDPVAFLEYFDYGLVRGLYDPQDSTFKLHPSLEETLRAKKVVYSNEKTRRRLDNFLAKLWNNEAGREVANVWELEDARPKEVAPTPVPFMGSKKGTSSLSQLGRQLDQPFGVLYERPNIREAVERRAQAEAALWAQFAAQARNNPLNERPLPW